MRKVFFYIAIVYAAIILYGGIWIHHDTDAPRKNFDAKRALSEGKTDQPDGFLKFQEGIRTRDGDPGPRYQHGYKWRALQSAIAARRKKLRSSRAAAGDLTIEWKERGPGNVPGRTRAVMNIPGDPLNNTWLAGAATGGIWRTTDGGMTWSERSGDFPSLPISSFGSDKNASVIYAGTGELVSSFYSAIGNGIFKSTDKGVTWSQLPSTSNHPDFSIVTRVIAHPDNPAVVVATTAPHNQSTDKSSSIMRSSNGGLTWQKVNETQGIFEQITYNPSNFNIQYASQRGVGVWKSVDGGLSWRLSNKGMDPAGRVEISVSPANPDVIFAAAEGSLTGTGSDMYYSGNAGDSWNLVNIQFNNAPVDFLDGQGYYDNTVLADPFNQRAFYVGGVSLFRVNLTSGSAPVANYNIRESGTASFLFLQSFYGNQYDHGRLKTGPRAGKNRIEIRFGPNISQLAHRFLVPVNKTSGLASTDYTYQDYVKVPFQVWDAGQNRQLMVSFRDQNRNNKFDLLPMHLTDGGTDYLKNSREYIFIHDVTYTSSPSGNIAKTAGHEFNLVHNIFPSLTENAVWNESSLPASMLVIEYTGILKFNANTAVVADGRGEFNNRNRPNQVELTQGLHPDHHCMTAIIENTINRSYRILLGNDGGVFVSKSSTEPGTREGDWQFRGFGMNTGQFYGADRNPVAEQYIGGLQDNGTRISPKHENASSSSAYFFGLEGDGFETIWNSKDPTQLLGTRYYGQISRSTDGGETWNVTAVPSIEFPFVTKLANSANYPDRVFTVGSKGVYVSPDFGESWALTSIPSGFVIGTPFYLDVEVSRANANIVWAGSGMNNSTNRRSLFVSVDGGKSFSPAKNYTDVVLGNITKLASHPTEPHTAYALFSFYGAPKILRTTDLGQTWQDISGFGTNSSSTNGFPDVAVYCLYVRPDNPDIIWAGTEIGIVESTDNGQTWSLLEEFPHVTVWDMKGHGDEVVIATHGRGIWTAKIGKPEITVPAPRIVAAGSTPQGNFSVRLKTETQFDSLLLYINSEVVVRRKDYGPRTEDLIFGNIQSGEKKLKIVGFQKGIPFQSMVYPVTHHEILSPREIYTTSFRSTEDLAITGMSMQIFEGVPVSPGESLQTDHDYSVGTSYEIFIRTPIEVAEALPRIIYTDLAIVEPHGDSVVLEATINGLDWVTLATYDATFNSSWHQAFLEKRRGNQYMHLDHDIDFSPYFQTGELVLFRFRLVSDSAVTGWGWSVKQVSIQQLPTSTEDPVAVDLNVYPNPARDKVTLDYTLTRASQVTITLLNSFGGEIKHVDMGEKAAGYHQQFIEMSDVSPGMYVVIVTAGDKKYVRKIVRQ